MSTGAHFLNVWSVPLGTAASEPGILSKDEKNRLKSMPPARAEEFAKSRTALRHILADYLRIPAASIKFAYGSHGKPELRGRDKNADIIHFNLAHAEGLALIAVTDAGPVGVDVEHLRHIGHIRNLAAETFGPDMAAFLEPLSDEQRVRTLLTRWVRSEAAVKQNGGDMARDYRNAAMPLSPDVPARGVVDIDVGPDYVAALSLGRRRSATISPEIRAWPEKA